MEALCAGLEPAWFVGEGEADAYRAAGAERVTESGGLCVSRNRALDDALAAGARLHLQLSDDLTRLGWAHGVTRPEVESIDVGEACRRMAIALKSTGAALAGGSPTDNPYFAKPGIGATNFIVGDMVLVRLDGPRTPRWDVNLSLKEDYDYTLQHLTAYGKVARCNALLASFKHRTNVGGAVNYRTADLEQANIAYLIGKWPGSLRLNPKRPNELLLRWRA